MPRAKAASSVTAARDNVVEVSTFTQQTSESNLCVRGIVLGSGEPEMNTVIELKGLTV